MNFFDIARTHYFHETDRRRELNAALSLPLGVLTVLFAAIAAMVGSLSIPLGFPEIAIGLLSVSASVAGCLSIYFSFRSYIGYEYRHPASMGSLWEWRKQALDSGISEFRVEQDIANIMREQYVLSAEVNTLNNDRKSAFLHRSGTCMAVCLVLVILSGLPYAYLQLTAESASEAAGVSGAIDVGSSSGVRNEQR